MGSAARAFAVLALLAIAAQPAAAIVADEVVEEVDISSLKYARVDITYVLPGRYLETLDAALLNGRCALLSSVTGCRSSLLGGEDKVTYNMVEPSPEIGVKDLSLGSDRITVEFYFKYLPKQFVLAQGLMVRERGMSIRYPTHTTVLNYVLDMPFVSQFAVSARGEPLSASLDKTTFVIGETIPLPKVPDGTFCIGALLDGDTILVREHSRTCSPFMLGTSAFIAPGSYDVALIALTGSSIRYKRIPVQLEGSDIPTYLSLSADRCNLGEPFTVNVSSSAPLDWCTVHLVDPLGNEVLKREARTCDTVIIGTSPALAPGRYLVKAYAYIGEERGAASSAITLVGQGYSSSTVGTDSDVYSAGDTIEVVTDARGDYCLTELFDSSYNKVAEAESPGCEAVRLLADESLSPGDYLIKTTVQQEGRIVSVAAKGIGIRPWSAGQGTVESELCQAGLLNLLGERFPCISAGEVCVPSSSAKPLCLCFSEGSPKAFCDYGHTCGEGGCSAEKVVKTPFIIIRDAGACVARKGDQTISCIELGEICGGNCVCLNDRFQPLSSCVAGDTCTFDGCRRSVVEFEPEKLEPPSVRADELAAGAAVEWRGQLRLEGKLYGGSRADLSFTMQLGDIKLEDGAIEASYVSDAEGWRVSGTLAGAMEPGSYELFLIVRRGDDVHIVRRPYEVWHPSAASALSIELRDTNPTRLSYRELTSGAGIELRVRASDPNGGALSSKDLPAKAFKLSLEAPTGLRRVVEGRVSDPVYRAGLWELKGTFLADDYDKSADTILATLVVAVGHLGRSGRASVPVTLMKAIPLEVRVKRIDPGTELKPVYHLMAVTGFDMDLYLEITGSVALQGSNFHISLDDLVIRPDCTSEPGKPCIGYIVDTEEGVRVHLSNVNLCPSPPPPNSMRDLKIRVEEQGQESEARIAVRIVENPGRYQVRCS